MSPVILEDPIVGRITLLTASERQSLVQRLNEVASALSKPGLTVRQFTALTEECRLLEYRLAADSFNPAARTCRIRPHVSGNNRASRKAA